MREKNRTRELNRSTESDVVQGGTLTQEVGKDGECQSVRLGKFTLTEPICTARSCINRSLSIIGYDVY